MKSKFKILVIIIVIIILFIGVRACNNKVSNVIRNDIDKETQSSAINDRNKTKDWNIEIPKFLYKEIDYTKFPLSETFKKKFSTIEDILNGTMSHVFENDYFDSYNENMSNIITVTAKTGNGFEEIAYQLHYIINEKNELDDIEILDSKKIFDEIGNPITHVKYRTYEESPLSAVYFLCNPKRYGDIQVYLTDKYKNEHKNYETESILPWTEWLYIEEPAEKDQDNKYVFYVKALSIELTVKYKLTFVIDEKGYVDDVIVDEIEQKVTEDPEAVQDEYYEYYS